MPAQSADTVVKFLLDEARALDDHRFDDWLGMLAPDIFYEVPIPTAGDGWPGYLLEETYDTLVTRVRRLQSPSAWSEQPPSRTRRLVTNIWVDGNAPSGGGERFDVTCNFALFSYRGDASTPVVVTGERVDSVRVVGDDPQLCRRTVSLDSMVVPLSPLSVLL